MVTHSHKCTAAAANTSCLVGWSFNMHGPALTMIIDIFSFQKPAFYLSVLWNLANRWRVSWLKIVFFCPISDMFSNRVLLFTLYLLLSSISLHHRWLSKLINVKDVKNLNSCITINTKLKITLGNSLLGVCLFHLFAWRLSKSPIWPSQCILYV